jgi:2-haloacid dehalogenase
MPVVRTISFDCYGTLIDWQTGILRAARPVLERHGIRMADEEIVLKFAAAERQAEHGAYITYKGVLRKVMRELVGDRGRGVAHEELDVLWRSIGEWPAFGDTASALKRLKAKFRVCIASNIDNDLFALTLPKLGIKPDVVVTAEQVCSYKPGEAHFRELLKRLGAQAEEVLHAGESVYHDVEPASAMGFQTVWVNRQGAGASASGGGVQGGRADKVVSSVAELADWLRC